jgi:hypothetical protein
MPRKREASYQPTPKERLDQWAKGPGARDRPTSVVRELSARFKQRPKKADAQPQ